MKKLSRNLLRKFHSLLGTSYTETLALRSWDLKELMVSTNEILVRNYLKDNLENNPRYNEVKRLNKYEYKVFSQFGEDGIIEEIFKRIGLTNKYFVEFGGSGGLYNNTTFLLIQDWKGYWIEANPDDIKSINEKFSQLIKAGKLKLRKEFITAENIEQLFKDGEVPEEFDFLNIDLDGNDYWIWKALRNYRPRVVMIEYNASLPPEVPWIMAYNINHTAQLPTTYSGASLKSLERLGQSKGYSLVGCDFAGSNAFFVRNDLTGDLFLKPFSAENHYEPPRFFLEKRNGHPPGFGDFVTGDEL